MSQSCKIFNTEYGRQYIKKELVPTETYLPRDYFSERLEAGQIDPKVASIPTRLDEASEKLITKHILDNQRSVYQVTYKNPWDPRIDEEKREEAHEEKKDKEEGFQSELINYIRNTFFDPHDEEILAPPVTTKRIFGYIRPKLLHGSLSMYQDTHGRAGGIIMLRDN